MKEAFFGIAITIAMLFIFSQSNEIKKLKQTTTEKTEMVKKLKEENALLHQAQDLENFLMMLLSPEQKKQFLTLEDYIEQYKYKGK